MPQAKVTKVKLEFMFDRELCDTNPELVPLCTPEGIADKHDDMSVECSEGGDCELSTCLVLADGLYSDEDEEVLSTAILQRFVHLPCYLHINTEYEYSDESPVKAKYPPAMDKNGLIRVELIFRFDREGCDEDTALVPLRTPEGIADELNITIECQEGAPGHLSRCVASRTVHSGTDQVRDGFIKALVSSFEHLPGYSFVDVELMSVDESPTKQFKCQCLFRSVLPFLTLRNLFKEHIANGNLVGNGMVSDQYVAFVCIEAVSGQDIESICEALLSRAFGANTEESAGNFMPISTTPTLI